MIKIGSKLKILKTANKATALLPNGKISKVASMEDKSEYSDDFIYFIARALTANVPNANGDYFPDDELEKSYESFIGKNLHLNHDADDVAKAVGKIIDAWFVRTDGDIYVVCLCKIDKKLHPELARNIETGIIDSVSMGCSCQECECSICGCKAHNESEMCEHLKNFLGREIDVNGEKKKVSSINRGITFNELSLVGDPADSNAHMYQIYANKRGNDMKKKAMQDGKTEDVVQEEVKQEIEKTLKDKEETETKAEEKTVKEEVKEVKEEIKETVEQLDQAKEIIEEKKEELKELKEEVKDIKEEKKEEKVEEVKEETKEEETIEKEESCGKKADKDKCNKVIELLKKEKVETDEASPNFVADFANKKGIELTSDEIVWVSDNYNNSVKKEESCKKAETAEEIKDIEEIKEKAKEAIEEDKAKESGETTETETKEETKEEVVEEKKEEDKPAETVEEVKEKVEDIKEEVMAEIGDIFSPVKDETKEFKITDIFEDNGEKFVETEVEGKKKVYALKNVKVKKQAEAPAKPTTAPSAGMKWVFNKNTNAWEQKPENTKTVEVEAKKDLIEFDIKKVEKTPTHYFVKCNDTPNAATHKDKETGDLYCEYGSEVMDLEDVKRMSAKEYKYTLIKASKQPRWLVIDKATNKIAQKLFLKDLPKEASSFEYKKVIASAIKEVGLNKVAAKLGVSKTAIKADDKYTLTKEDGSTEELTVKSISINDVTKETFINVQIGGGEGDNIFSLSKFMKMLEEGQLQKVEEGEKVEEVKEETVVEETAENNVEQTEDTAPVNPDETAEPLNDLQSARKQRILKRKALKHLKVHKKAEIELDEDEQAKVDEIINNVKPVAVKYEGNSEDGYSVLVKDKNSDFDAWVDVWINEDYHDVETDWNQYIFSVDSEEDRIQQAVQDNTDVIYDMFTSAAIGYLEDKGLVVNGNKGWSYGKGGKKSSKQIIVNKKAEAGDGELVPQEDATPDFKVVPEVQPNETNTLETEDVKKDIIKTELSPVEEIANLMNILQIKLSEVDDKESKLDFVRREIQDAIDYVDGKPIEEIEKGEEEELDVPEIAEFTDIKWEESDNAELPAVASVDVDDINWNNINAKRDGAMILAHIYKAKPLSYKVAFKKVNKMDKVASKTNKVSFVGILKEQIKLAKEEVETMKITAQIKEKKELCEGIVKKAMAKGLVHIDSEEIRKNILKGMSQMEAREMAVKKAADEQVKNLMAMDKAQITAYKGTVANFQIPVFKEKKQSIGRITASADYDETVVLPWSRKR